MKERMEADRKEIAEILIKLKEIQERLEAINKLIEKFRKGGLPK